MVPIITESNELFVDEIPGDQKGYEFDGQKWIEKHPEEQLEQIHDRRGCEFINDQWIEKNRIAESDLVGGNLLAELKPFVRSRQLGFVFGPECGYQFFTEETRKVRKPDVSFVRRDRLTDNKPPRSNIRIAPDFVAEVVSPNDLAEDLNQKLVDYLSNGVSVVWVIYPQTRSVWIYRSSGSANWTHSTGEVSGEDILSDFRISLDTLFADL
jgi:Uma2 family endonuclease